MSYQYRQTSRGHSSDAKYTRNARDTEYPYNHVGAGHLQQRSSVNSQPTPSSEGYSALEYSNQGMGPAYGPQTNTYQASIASRGDHDHLNYPYSFDGTPCFSAVPPPPVSSIYPALHSYPVVDFVPQDSASAASPASNSLNIQTHVRSHFAVDEDVKDGKYRCVCGKEFGGAAKDAKHNRKRHIDSSNNGKIFECRFKEQGCDRTANRRDNLVPHMRNCQYRQRKAA